MVAHRYKGISRSAGTGLLLTLLAATGCSSVPHLESDQPRPYGGVLDSGHAGLRLAKAAVAEEQPQAAITAVVFTPVLAVDLACCAVVDTLTLPWAVYRMRQPGPALFAPYSIPRFM